MRSTHVHRAQRALSAMFCLAAFAMALNAWTYSYANGIPLVQSDAWIFLDTYIRKYLENGFGWKDLFLQGRSSDTNLPLHKLITLFEINHFHLDYKVEGLIGTAAGVALVGALMLTPAGSRPMRWRAASLALLAWLAMCTLSLDSTNVYTWPLATMWFLNLLIVALYFVYMARATVGPRGSFLATLLLGILVDEVALITVAAAVLALAHRDVRPVRNRGLQAAGAILGLAVVRGAYAWFNAANGVAADPSGPGMLHGLISIVASHGVYLALVPLGDSLVHQSVRTEWFPHDGDAVGTAIGAVLALAHVWFWWRAFALNTPVAGRALPTRRLAIALMLFFYGTVAGIALQRIPEFGIAYLHQPRYVIFYQLNLCALGLMAYAEYCLLGQFRRRVAGAAAVVALLAMSVLQWNLGVRAWDHAKYLSVYVEGTAQTMGQIAANPAQQVQCSDILRVCDFPPWKRRELMYLLQNYRLNVFNEDFQALYRLRPTPSPAAAPTAPAAQTPVAADARVVR